MDGLYTYKKEENGKNYGSIKCIDGCIYKRDSGPPNVEYCFKASNMDYNIEKQCDAISTTPFPVTQTAEPPVDPAAAAAAAGLLALLETESPAVGAEWPRIPGPLPQDRVCVVGAGMSGVHMAARLKGLGYNDVRMRTL